LGATAITAAARAIELDLSLVDETIMGQVLTAGEGMNPARQAARSAGIPDRASAMVVNQVCGSGLRAVALGVQQIQTGAASVMVCGGQESMSRAPHLVRLRSGIKYGDATLTDSVQLDGLQDAFYGYPMGATAENLARHYAIGRAEQDAFALLSQSRASKAAAEGKFNAELSPVAIATRQGEQLVTADEHIRHELTPEQLSKLKPAFDAAGTVTAGNSSGINDGAAAVILASVGTIKTHNLKPLASIKAWACAGVDPALMGLGPVPASRLALQRADWSVNDVELWEINEAFAVQALVVMKELALDPALVNVNGGAIALGHPIGASGARVLVTLVHALQQRRLKRGVATLCIGGGMGIAMCVECA
jgi:acetyl-CoA C-acetyltransferase